MYPHLILHNYYYSSSNMHLFFFVNRATGFTTRSDIGPARDADDIP